jgi:MATE family multidrug resistance protein
MGEYPSSREDVQAVLRLAWPLVLSNSLWTLQIFIDRIFLGHSGSESLAAGMVSAVVFWTILTLFQNIVNYATTFVAQYTGAGRHAEVGPVVWQALYFAGAAGAVFASLSPLAGPAVGLAGHTPELQSLEATYLRCLCLAGLPTLVTSAACSFFAGRGQSRTVLVINGVGLAVNAVTAYGLIFGHWGLPAWGIAGAGVATVLGSSASAVLGMVLLLRPRYRAACRTLAGWRLDGTLLGRLLRFGVPNGIFSALDALAFTLFLTFVGRLGEVQLAASTVAFTLNLLCILPMLGIGQAVEVLVGQHLGADRPDTAARLTWVGLGLATTFTGVMVLGFLLFPERLAGLFRGEADTERWEQILEHVPVLLRFVSLYALFDCVNLVVSFALRGAGDTRFVTRVALALPWPTMVLPTWAAWHQGWGLYWAWAFASLYIMALAVVFLVRFRQGKWRSMRVIAPQPAD